MHGCPGNSFLSVCIESPGGATDEISRVLLRRNRRGFETDSLYEHCPTVALTGLGKVRRKEGGRQLPRLAALALGCQRPALRASRWRDGLCRTDVVPDDSLRQPPPAPESLSPPNLDTHPFPSPASSRKPGHPFFRAAVSPPHRMKLDKIRPGRYTAGLLRSFNWFGA
jgi:hypothetical protein